MSASDIRQDGWIDRLPAQLKPYAVLARWDRPIGIWLLLFPCWWGTALAGSMDLARYGLFAIGAIAMRGAGCTINDMIDSDIDARVARTAARPLASGAMSMRAALMFLAIQLAVALTVLLTFSSLAIAVGAASLALVVTYPLMKRVTWWPQAVLGLAFNWGALLGWIEARGALEAPALWLYAGGIAWTIGYDTIYALQDARDDRAIGVRSTALLFGSRVRFAVAAFYTLAGLCFLEAIVTSGHGAFAIGGLALAALHFARQVNRIDREDAAGALALFRSNTAVGWILLIGLLTDRLILE